MQTLHGKTFVVAGGTGNVGAFIVRALLERGATVAVPSRSVQSLTTLRAYLSSHVGEADLDRLHTFVGIVGEESGTEKLREQITDVVGSPDAVVATLGGFIPAPSLLDATTDDLQRVLDAFLLAHFVVARTFLPDLKERGGTYVFINGPLAFEPWKGSEAGLVSTVTAAQHMLFRSLAQELEDSAARVVELVNYAFIREKRTQPSSPLPGEDVGAYVAHLVSGDADLIHGKSIHLKSPEQLKEIDIVS